MNPVDVETETEVAPNPNAPAPKIMSPEASSFVPHKYDFNIRFETNAPDLKHEVILRSEDGQTVLQKVEVPAGTFTTKIKMPEGTGKIYQIELGIPNGLTNEQTRHVIKIISGYCDAMLPIAYGSYDGTLEYTLLDPCFLEDFSTFKKGDRPKGVVVNLRQGWIKEVEGERKVTIKCVPGSILFRL